MEASFLLLPDAVHARHSQEVALGEIINTFKLNIFRIHTFYTNTRLFRGSNPALKNMT